MLNGITTYFIVFIVSNILFIRITHTYIMRTLLLASFLLSLLSLGCGFFKKKDRLDDSKKVTISSFRVPILVEKKENIILELQIESEEVAELTGITILFTKESPISHLNEVVFNYPNEGQNQTFGTRVVDNRNITIEGIQPLKDSINIFSLSLTVKNNIDISKKISIESIQCLFNNGEKAKLSFEDNYLTWRLGNVVRAAGEDDCDTYRIPGLVTTNKGTLIAVYDNRYNNSKDLQEDIDVGMSRSVDGGQTWQPMQIIMDMGEWGGLSQRLNGIGDPCVLYDHTTHTIWVAALWMHGSQPDKMAWIDSKPGMEPGETGQFVIVNSTDDGHTWSKPINITKQIKEPEWQLLLQGPGRGITLDDGTLIFPAQFKSDLGEKALDGGKFTSHSTLVYSKDGGQNWHIGTGAKSNTTEAQVAVLSDGSLMLNMRDDRNRKDKSASNGRAIATTNNLGETWKTHPTSNSVLTESNCMASLISAPLRINDKTVNALFFSNPNNKSKRTNMTIKASLDEGMTWPYELEVNETKGFGYSCLTMIDDKHIGILYEGVKELFFQKIAVEDLIHQF